MGLPTKTCTIEGCEKKHYANGFCGMHNARNKKHGSPYTVERIVGDPDASFWSKVDKTETCWNWTAHINSRGYGQTSYKGGEWMAHRLSYVMAFGPIADGVQIDHKCHNRACVNPGHLQEVTNKQNAENRAGADVRNRTGVRGVGWNEKAQSWFAHVKHHGKNHYKGKLRTAAHAERWAITKRLELFTNSIKDQRIPKNVDALHRWHEAKHPFEWKACPYEPCALMHEDFRDAWSA